MYICILLFFYFYVFYCFMISAVWDLHLDQYQAELMIYTKQKEDKITDLQAKIKNSLCHLFCTQHLWSQKVTLLSNGRSDFHKLGVRGKICLGGGPPRPSAVRVKNFPSRWIWSVLFTCLLVYEYTYVYVYMLCHMSWIHLSFSNGIHILRVFRVRCKFLMEWKSWSRMHCFFLLFFLDLRWRLALCMYTHTTHTNIAHNAYMC